MEFFALGFQYEAGTASANSGFNSDLWPVREPG